MIIRHAEKPDGTAPGLDEDGNEDDSSLTAVGWQRARGLVDLFDPTRGDPRPGIAVPDRIYAAGVTDDGEGQRTPHDEQVPFPFVRRAGAATTSAMRCCS